MVDPLSLVAYCDRFLDSGNFDDYAPNGLQVEGERPITRLASGVTASAALIEAATAWGADSILVHHGWFWRGEAPCLVGIKGRRARRLFKAGASLIAYHLPLDAHPQVGNNAALAAHLGWVDAEPVEDRRGLLWSGRLALGCSPEAFAAQVSERLGRPATLIAAGRERIERIAWCTGGGQGYVLEYRGSAIESLSMEGRMTICNMSIEAGAKAGMIAPDQTTFDYVKGRAHAPTGAAWDEAVAHWRTLASDPEATFDKEVRLDGAEIFPHISWGTNPGQVAPITSAVPDPGSFDDPAERDAAERALEYMGLAAGTPLKEVAVDTVFIGSCTNGRIEDLRAVAEVARGRRVSSGLRTLVVPGSWAVKTQAEAEGIDQVLTEAGFDWRDPGCSMCLAMNPDKLAPGERSASTSNRNFEGRQGRGGRTHLVSPAVAAATAITGHLAAPADLIGA